MTNPETSRIETLVNKARKLARQGEDGVAEARRLLEQEIRSEPNEYLPLDAEVEILVRNQDADLARQLLEEFLRWHPNTADASARLSWLMWEVGEREEAIAEVRATLARQPDHLGARLWLIEWMEEQRETEALRTVAEEGLKHHPLNNKLQMVWAATELRRGNANASIEIYREILSRDPDWMPALRALSLLLSRRKQHDEAVRLIGERAEKTDAGLKTLCCATEVFFQGTNVRQALEFAARAANHKNGNSKEPQRKLVETIFRILRLEDSKPFVFELLESRGVCDEFASALVDHFAAVPDQQGFDRVLDTIAKHPAHFSSALENSLTNHGAIWNRRFFDEWLKNRHNEITGNLRVWAAVGKWLFDRGDFQSAADVLQRGRNRKGVKPATLLVLGTALERIGRDSESNQVYRDALQLKTDGAESSIRARLAFNLAIDGYEATGHLILDDCTSEGKKLAEPDDLIRIFAVETFMTAHRLNDFHQLRELYAQTSEHMKRISQERPSPEAERLIHAYNQRWSYLLSIHGSATQTSK